MRQSLTDATRQARALAANGRLAEATALYKEIAAANPGSAVALHNLASALGDAGDWTAALPLLRRAMSMGLDAPETWLALARAQQTLGALDEAERAYGESLRRRLSIDAHRELAQLRWMRSGNIGAALALLERAITAAPGSMDLQIVKAQALMECGDAPSALALLEGLSHAAPRNAVLAAVAAQAALAAGRPDDALRLARAAKACDAGLPAAHAVLIETLLQVRSFEDARDAAEEFRQRAPLNQHAIALQATVWRALGDPRYGDLYDYDAFVQEEMLEAPPGWPSLSMYLADLGGALKQAHHFQMHPFAQSVRRGSQAANVLQLPHPATQALRTVLDKPIRAYLDRLGAGAGPLRARNRGSYVFQGVWSILMRAGGAHINHVHPQGWISSACYVETPQANAREGWLKLGEPSVDCGLGPEHHVEPIPGKLVLFPSYMWHGTAPFSTPGVRLTFAFDLVPAGA